MTSHTLKFHYDKVDHPEQVCRKCLYGVWDGEYLQCHRYPQHYTMEYGYPAMLWPRVDPYTFCGEWGPIDE